MSEIVLKVKIIRRKIKYKNITTQHAINKILDSPTLHYLGNKNL